MTRSQIIRSSSLEDRSLRKILPKRNLHIDLPFGQMFTIYQHLERYCSSLFSVFPLFGLDCDSILRVHIPTVAFENSYKSTQISDDSKSLISEIVFSIFILNNFDIYVRVSSQFSTFAPEYINLIFPLNVLWALALANFLSKDFQEKFKIQIQQNSILKALDLHLIVKPINIKHLGLFHNTPS